MALDVLAICTGTVLRAGHAGSTPASLFSFQSISPSEYQSSHLLHFVPAGFPRVYPTEFSRFFLVGYRMFACLWAPMVGYAECTPISLYPLYRYKPCIYEQTTRIPFSGGLRRRACPLEIATDSDARFRPAE